MIETNHEEALLFLLAKVYTPEGIEVWLAHAEKEGWTMEEKVAWAWRAAEGVFS